MVWRVYASDCDDEATPAPYHLTCLRWLHLAMGGACAVTDKVRRACAGDCDDEAMLAPHYLTYQR